MRNLTPQRVTYVGVGKMGAPMARLLAASGFELTVYARRAEMRTEFAALGARTSTDLAEAVQGARTVCVCLFDENQLRDVLLGEHGLIARCEPGAALVCHTTTGLETLGRLAAAAEDRGIAFVDAPVSGAADEIESGRLTVLAGGAPEALDLVEPVLTTYSTVVRTGSVGTASRAKLVNNLLFAANVQLLASAARLAQGLGIGGHDLLGALAGCSASSEALRMMRATGRTPEEFGTHAAKYLTKDVTAALRAASELHADPSLLEHVVRQGPIGMLSA